MPELFTPKIEGSYGIMAVEVHSCAVCKKTMVFGPDRQYLRQTFPLYQDMAFGKQLDRAGWEQASDMEVDGKHMCQKCAKAGLAMFECALCGQKVAGNAVEESFGDPAEFLCKRCYETVPAKTWNEKVTALRERHRYDFD
jgi:hypothetical protein